jgi:hypothetical protein
MFGSLRQPFPSILLGGVGGKEYVGSYTYAHKVFINRSASSQIYKVCVDYPSSTFESSFFCKYL